MCVCVCVCKCHGLHLPHLHFVVFIIITVVIIIIIIIMNLTLNYMTTITLYKVTDNLVPQLLQDWCHNLTSCDVSVTTPTRTLVTFKVALQ